MRRFCAYALKRIRIKSGRICKFVASAAKVLWRRGLPGFWRKYKKWKLSHRPTRIRYSRRPVPNEPRAQELKRQKQSTGNQLITYAQKDLFHDKPKHYLLTYKEYFAPLIENEVKLLELGVSTGSSLIMWRDYFPKGTIVGLDINVSDLGEPRIHTYQGRQEDTALLTRIAQEHAPGGFDIIIDDCAHIGELARTSFWHLFEHHLKPGGIYAIEDWGTGYMDNHIYYPDGHTYRLGEKETAMHWLANRMLKQSPVEWPHLNPLQRLLRRHQYTRRFRGHDYGMVGFVKQLVDECGMSDITNPDYASRHPRIPPTPQIPSKISRMLVVPGLVIVSKV